MDRILARATDLQDHGAREEWVRTVRRKGELSDGREIAWRRYFHLVDMFRKHKFGDEFGAVMREIMERSKETRSFSILLHGDSFMIEPDLVDVISSIWRDR
ncbi:MAG: hypothetical protein GF334_11170 [Candidatus Altiarchaeales archaeon]|nr:hypothetical protein [Candidatus Altiarchaeales archaeon]